MILKVVFVVFSLSLLIYMVMPGPTQVSDFPALPSSIKSDEPGDTVQVPNVAAYFSDFWRRDVISTYWNRYQNLTLFPFSPMRLNYPPEYAYTAIKDQTRSTYLEELIYPLRDSLFINGFEPFYESGEPKYWGATRVEVGEATFNSKAILRFYPSPLWVRAVVWAGINLSLIWLWKLGWRVIKND